MRWWWGGTIGVGVVNLVLTWILAAILGTSMRAGIVPFVVQLIVTYPAFAVNTKRFQDRDKAGWLGIVGPGLHLLFQFLAVVGLAGDPLHQNAFDYLYLAALLGIGIWYLVDLGCLKGTTGPNRFGPDPLAAR